MKTSEFLIKAKSLIADPENWTQEDYARDSKGDGCFWNEPQATCFCSIGALYKVGGLEKRTYQLPYNVKQSCDLLKQQMEGYVPAFNDSHTHEQVMQAWDRAIAQAVADEEKEG